MKKKLLISFSGGRTSAYMTNWLLENKQGEYEMVVVFANTGKEKEETLKFVHKCDVLMGFNVVWIETVMNEYGTGATFKVVNYRSANRDGLVFEQVIAKHGIPNMSSKHCTREMKSVPINKYIKSIGWTDYETAIGFRIDEPKRFKGVKKEKAAKAKKHIYPLVYQNPKTKKDINDWWETRSFNLELQNHQGNCDLCWKKGENKLIALIGADPLLAIWWQKMESDYENYTPASKVHNSKIKPPHRFYRGNTSINELIEKANKFFEGAKTEHEIDIYCQALLNNYNPKQVSLCEESCEPFE